MSICRLRRKDSGLCGGAERNKCCYEIDKKITEKLMKIYIKAVGDFVKAYNRRGWLAFFFCQRTYILENRKGLWGIGYDYRMASSLMKQMSREGSLDEARERGIRVPFNPLDKFK
jgi:hypothetical protein